MPSTAASAATPAPLGRFVSIVGATTSNAAPVGFFVGVTGASAATPASPGTFVNIIGASAATAAQPGFFVDSTAATAQTPAPAGRFVSEFGATAATDAPVGFFVPNTGASAATPAPAGRFVPFAGATAALDCPPGSQSFGAAPACRGDSRVDPSLTGPLLGFASPGDEDRWLGRIPLGQATPVVLSVSNPRQLLGYVDPLTRLTLLSVNAPPPLSAVSFVAGTIIDEGEAGSVSLAVTPARLGLLETDYSIETDADALLGLPGRSLVGRIRAEAGGVDLQVQWLTPLMRAVSGGSSGLRLRVRNVGDEPSADVMVDANAASDLVCVWSLVASRGGATGSGSVGGATLSDLVDLPAGAEREYAVSCQLPMATGVRTLSAQLTAPIPDPFPDNDSAQAQLDLLAAPQPGPSQLRWRWTSEAFGQQGRRGSWQLLIEGEASKGDEQPFDLSVLAPAGLDAVEWGCSGSGVICPSLPAPGETRLVASGINAPAPGESYLFSISGLVVQAQGSSFALSAVAVAQDAGGDARPLGEQRLDVRSGLFYASFE